MSLRGACAAILMEIMVVAEEAMSCEDEEEETTVTEVEEEEAEVDMWVGMVGLVLS